MGDVEGVTDILTVHVVSDDIANLDTVVGHLLQVLGKLGVLSLRNTTSVGLLFTVHDRGSILSVVDGEASGEVGSVEIVPVEVPGELVDLGPSGGADWGFGGRAHVHEISMAVVFFPLGEQGLGNDAHTGNSLGKGRVDIVGPVGGTVSDHGALDIDVVELVVEFRLQVVLVDLPGEVGHVDSGVGLTRDEKLRLFELGELGVEILEGVHGVNRLNHVVGFPVLLGASSGEADTSGTLEPHNVSAGVPGEGVLVDTVGAVFNNTGTILLHEAEHGRASRATVEPDHDGVGLGVVERLGEDVMEFLGLSGREVAGVGVTVEGRSLGEGSHEVFCGGSHSDGSEKASNCEGSH